MLSLDPPPSQTEPLTITDLTAKIRQTLETSFSQVRVIGEISGLRRPASGHLYFSLKDENAQIGAVLWRSQVRRLSFALEEGMEVVAQGGLDVYPARGVYQLLVRQIEPQGIGPLGLAFRQLHSKLKAEGLFDPRHKKPLPEYPRRIGLITSSSGAAVKDVLNVLLRRWQMADVLILPSLVQGEGAAGQLARRLEQAATIDPPLDVVILTRGGGSLEDLWAFNEELLARAIFACPIPTISAVGHEIDITISDLVADCRAQTPTEAGELVVPKAAEKWDRLLARRQSLAVALRRRLALAQSQLESLARRRVLTEPQRMIRERERLLDDQSRRLSQAIGHRLTTQRERLVSLDKQLAHLNPASVLGRGYSWTTHHGVLLRSAQGLQEGDALETRFCEGSVWSRVVPDLSNPPTQVTLFDEETHHGNP